MNIFLVTSIIIRQKCPCESSYKDISDETNLFNTKLKRRQQEDIKLLHKFSSNVTIKPPAEK